MVGRMCSGEKVQSEYFTAFFVLEKLCENLAYVDEFVTTTNQFYLQYILWNLYVFAAFFAAFFKASSEVCSHPSFIVRHCCIYSMHDEMLIVPL